MKRKNTKLLEAIWASGLTQVEVVKKAGISSEARLSRIINFLLEPTEEEARKIAKLLNRPVRALGFLNCLGATDRD